MRLLPRLATGKVGLGWKRGSGGAPRRVGGCKGLSWPRRRARDSGRRKRLGVWAEALNAILRSLVFNSWTVSRG